jgi:hypothetical protein
MGTQPRHTSDIQKCYVQQPGIGHLIMEALLTECFV